MRSVCRRYTKSQALLGPMSIALVYKYNILNNVAVKLYSTQKNIYQNILNKQNKKQICLIIKEVIILFLLISQQYSAAFSEVIESTKICILFSILSHC